MFDILTNILTGPAGHKVPDAARDAACARSGARGALPGFEVALQVGM